MRTPPSVRTCVRGGDGEGKARGRRAMDLLVAATALAQGIPLFTCNPADFQGLDSLIDIVPVDPE
jgi:predicted nucleic acid-binding protein